MPRLGPIHPRIAACARSLKQATPKITTQRAFERARREMEMPHLHFHDLRHSATSALVNAGVDLFTVGRILGHRDARSTQRSAHLAVDSLASAVNKIRQEVPTAQTKMPAVLAGTSLQSQMLGGEGGIRTHGTV
ncbi:tyrosine-type recombinase/integrase [Pandoraea terrigena]|uniref:tyrosine-type recombinase/integrase n=1 Tax=Pandoraea terrigena TaxID=2508292 RepID=UPI0015813B61|nr:tyrosine-type recombinase/integrase [Pandoraea terrigena]